MSQQVTPYVKREVARCPKLSRNDALLELNELFAYPDWKKKVNPEFMKKFFKDRFNLILKDQAEQQSELILKCIVEFVHKNFVDDPESLLEVFLKIERYWTHLTGQNGQGNWYEPEKKKFRNAFNVRGDDVVTIISSQQKYNDFRDRCEKYIGIRGDVKCKDLGLGQSSLCTNQLYDAGVRITHTPPGVCEETFIPGTAARRHLEQSNTDYDVLKVIGIFSFVLVLVYLLANHWKKKNARPSLKNFKNFEQHIATVEEN